MAERPSDGVVASAAAPASIGVGVTGPATSPGDGAGTRTPPTTLTSSFRAVNSRPAASEGAHAAISSNLNSKLQQQPAKQLSKSPNASLVSQTASDSPAATNESKMDSSDGAVESSTYGTRSRNRTGNARPNYAEDQDVEFDFSSAATTTSSKKKQQQHHHHHQITDEHAATASNGGDGRKALDAARMAAANTNGGTKESTPGVAGPATTGKKRKAGGAGAALGLHQGASTANSSAAPTSTRKSVAPSASSASSHSALAQRETNLMTFTKHKSRLNAKGEMVADDGSKLRLNDHVYLVCEPPGDPYYLCRIMEFLHTRSDDPSSPVEALRVNWYYRPRDVQRFNSDSRLVYGTMHSDICPIASLRGKCTIRHRSEIPDLEAYRKSRDSFYFVQVFDRFIRRWYECIPVAQIINVPDKVKKALDERWKFVVVETGRVKELTSAVKTCKRCAKYCASHDSVDCAICKNSYHMNCVQPPLPKKPSRGFAWSCGPCSRASERKLEQKNTPSASGNVTEAEEEEAMEEEQQQQPSNGSNESTRAPSPSTSDMDLDQHPATQAEIAMAQMWPMRYLGIHCRVEDALQYDDRAIYPRASSRLGPRHQANMTIWHGRPVELVKPSEIKKRYNKGPAKKDPKMTKEALAAAEAEREERAKRPKWVQDEPQGYVARGEDYPNDDPRNTARLMFKMPEVDELSKQGLGGTTSLTNGDSDKMSIDRESSTLMFRDEAIDSYVRDAKTYARDIGVPPFGANFLDKALELLSIHDFDQNVALRRLSVMDRVRDLHEPVLSRAELVKFEEGVAKYGSEHRLIHRHMRTDLPISTIIRFYYLWKKTPKGQDIWGNYGGRKGSKRKVENDAGAQLQASVAHDADDSAFDNDKATQKKRGFVCKFCNSTHSRQWRRAPGVSAGQTIHQPEGKNHQADAKNAKEKGKDLILALCLRCAGLWRKYAIQWEDIDDLAKKAGQGGTKTYKRRIDEELLREINAANEANNAMMAEAAAAAAAATSPESGEPPKKKSKNDATAEPPKKKEKPPPPPPKEPTPPPPPIIPAEPQWRELPCAVCKGVGNTIECGHCRLTVHRQCFGLTEDEGIQVDNGGIQWICEQCQNDRTPMVSTDYACCLCLTEETQIDLVEPPKISHKKKNDREREKERLEKELADNLRDEYRNRQLTMHRPVLPREPLKRTTGNNWVHVYCAVWTPEIRFSDSKRLEVAEGFQSIPPSRYEATCKLCKNKDHRNRARNDKGSCVSCFQCHANFHVSCAFEAGYVFGFDVTPVKGSRKDQIVTANLAGEVGAVSAAIWCKDHVVKTTVHPINEAADPAAAPPAGDVDSSSKIALQVYVENYKQADLTLTGTVRKANLAQLTKDKGQQSFSSSTSAAATSGSTASRRESGVNGIAAAVRAGHRNSSVAEITAKSEPGKGAGVGVLETRERRCAKCGIDVTPKWHSIADLPSGREPTPPKSPIRLAFEGEMTDRERAERFASADPAHQQQFNQNNIRFMAPGVSGRAWEGMPERYGPRAVAINGMPHHPQSMIDEGGRPDGMSGHEGQRQRVEAAALRDSSNPRAESDIKDPRVAPATADTDYLCHRCFIKQKTDPSPPPEERPSLSPANKGVTNNGDWTTRGPSPGSTFDPSKPIRMPQDDTPPRQDPPPPPHHPTPIGLMNLSVPYNGHGHPPQQQQLPHPQQQPFPPYGPSPTSGFHGPGLPGPPPGPHQGPPNAGPPPPPPPGMHERSGSFGFPGAPHPSQPQHPQQPTAQGNPPFGPPYVAGPPPQPSHHAPPFHYGPPAHPHAPQQPHPSQQQGPPHSHQQAQQGPLPNGIGSPPTYGSPSRGGPALAYPAFPPPPPPRRGQDEGQVHGQGLPPLGGPPPPHQQHQPGGTFQMTPPPPQHHQGPGQHQHQTSPLHHASFVHPHPSGLPPAPQQQQPPPFGANPHHQHPPPPHHHQHPPGQGPLDHHHAHHLHMQQNGFSTPQQQQQPQSQPQGQQQHSPLLPPHQHQHQHQQPQSLTQQQQQHHRSQSGQRRPSQSAPRASTPAAGSGDPGTTNTNAVAGTASAGGGTGAGATGSGGASTSPSLSNLIS